MTPIFFHRQRQDCVCFLEGEIISPGNFLSSLDPLLDFFQLTQPQGALKVGQPVVEPWTRHFVEPGTGIVALMKVAICLLYTSDAADEYQRV